MPSFTSISALLGVLVLVATPSAAGPVKQASDFDFKNAGPNQSTCPAADGTKYSAGGKNFGILCGWDTKSRSHKWGPYYHLTFHECIEKCAEKPGCSIATYTGTCYLKKSAKGKGFVRGNSPKNLAAIKLTHKGKGKGDDGDDDEKEHGKGKKKHHKDDGEDEKKHDKGKKKHHKADDDDEEKTHKGTKKHHEANDDGDAKTHSNGKKKHDGGVKKHHKDGKKKHDGGVESHHNGPKHGGDAQKHRKGPKHGHPTTKTYSLTYAQHHPTGIKIKPVNHIPQ